MNVTDGAGARAHLGAMAAATILHQSGIEPVLQLTCRDRNRLALQSDLIGAAALGIRNLLVLRGDDPSAGDQPDAKPVFDLDSGALIETAVAIRDRGELPSGRKVTGKADFFIGAADMPIDPPAGWVPKSLKGKIAAGAEFGILPCGLGSRNTLRLEAKLPLYGHEISERINVWEAGLDRWCKLEKAGDFIGRSALEKLKQQPLRRKLVGLEMIERGIARDDYPVLDNSGRKIGYVTSGSFAPFLKKNIALAYVPPEHAELGTELRVEIRGQAVGAKVVPTPFYRKPKKAIGN